MIEIRFLVELVLRHLSRIQTTCGKKRFGHFKLPLVGCAISLAVGCSTLPSHQTASMDHPALSKRPGGPPGMESSDTEAPPCELSEPKCELVVPEHPAIDAWVRRFTVEQHKSFQTQLDRARFYVAPAQAIFEEKGLPRDLVFVALVESGFTPVARSHANAVGMWQFIASTGKRFGLEQNRWIDERRHPFKSARAAADYLSFLYDMLGSWPLALAGYNAGENGVRAALDQSGLQTFWELAENGCLPAETRDYVPKFFAAVKIAREPLRYGFHFDPNHYTPRHETVTVPGGVRLSSLGKRIGVSESLLLNHNPELCQPITPPGSCNYELCVPIGKSKAVLTALTDPGLMEEKPSKASPKKSSAARGSKKAVAASDKSRAKATGAGNKTASGKQPATGTHKVMPGDTWFGLARKYGCSPHELAALNGMTPSQVIKIGQTLKTPSRGSPTLAMQKKGSVAKKEAASSLQGKNSKDTKLCQSTYSYYPIRQGDTLWSIARRFQISVDSICTHNEMDRNQPLLPGNVLTICTNEN